MNPSTQVEDPSSMLHSPIPLEAPVPLEADFSPRMPPVESRSIEAVPYAEPIERALNDPIPMPARIEQAEEIPTTPEVIAEPGVVQELPPAWEDAIDVRSIPTPPADRTDAATNSIPSETRSPSLEEESPSDLRGEQPQDSELLPPPSDLKEPFQNESEFETLPDGPPSDDLLIDESILGDVSAPPVRQPDPTVRLTSQWGPVVRVNPFVKQDSGRGAMSSQFPSGAQRSPAPERSAPVANPFKPRRIWSPVRQP